jgi:ABC-type sugar transport system permease subunit
MTKSIYPLIFSLIIVIFLAGCAGSQPAAAPATEPAAPAVQSETATEAEAPAAAEPAKENVTLTFMASQGWIKDAELELAKKFEAETGIHVVDIHWALPSVIGVDTWRGVGYIMIILIAGLQAIPRDYYEAAAIDGANRWQSFLHITLPLLRPVLTVTTVLNLLYGLKVFDIVFVLTNGGPGRATDTVYTAIFEDFSKGRYGVATALSSLLFLVMIALGYLVIRLMHQEEDV